ALVFGLFAGVLSDRVDRRRVVIAADGFRVLVLAGLCALIVTGRLTVFEALVALGLIAIAEVFADNTYSTLAPMLVHRDDLVLANARLQTAFVTLNQLVGPPIGAALFTLGRAWPFANQAILVAASVLFISRIVLPAQEKASERSSVRRDIAAGIRWTVHHPAVRTLALTILIFNVTFGA